jgi:DNA invertase Pin-like site-specific DNA recombinase
MLNNSVSRIRLPRIPLASPIEDLDLTSSIGRAMARMLAILVDFEREIRREQVRAGIAQARKPGRPHNRPRTASLKPEEDLRLKD